MTKEFTAWALECALKPHPLYYGIRWSNVSPAIGEILESSLGDSIHVEKQAQVWTVYPHKDWLELTNMIGLAKARQAAERASLLAIEEAKQARACYKQRLIESLTKGIPPISRQLAELLVDDYLVDSQEVAKDFPSFFKTLESVNKD